MTEKVNILQFQLYKVSQFKFVLFFIVIVFCIVILIIRNNTTKVSLPVNCLYHFYEQTNTVNLLYITINH